MAFLLLQLECKTSEAKPKVALDKSHKILSSCNQTDINDISAV